LALPVLERLASTGFQELLGFLMMQSRALQFELMEPSVRMLVAQGEREESFVLVA
jgi:hypothetical protein